jgi:hypothetical protein
MAPRRNRLSPRGIGLAFHRASIPKGRHRVRSTAHRAKRMAKRIGYFFPERVGLFVELSEAVAFGEVFDFYNYVIVHDYVVIFIC